MSEPKSPYHIDDTLYSPILVDDRGYPVFMNTSFDPQSCAVYAVLTDKEKDAIRQIVHEEVTKVFPTLRKPDIALPECPDCGLWDLKEHDMTLPLGGRYRDYWCSCPEKVAAWEARCNQALDDLLYAIHDPKDEVLAVLVEMQPEEFEALIEKVRVSRE